MSNSGTLLASGTRVSLRYAREATRNQSPAGLSGSANIASVATSASGAGYSDFTRASGSFITDGYFKGQKIRAVGWSASAVNADWIVHAVAAGTLTVRDPSDTIVDESAATGQVIGIVYNALRATGKNIGLEKNILESQEVDADGQETDVRHGFNRVAGSPGYQMSRADYDDFIEFVMAREWDEVAEDAFTGNMSVSSDRFVRSSGSWITDGYRPGDIVRGSGFSNSANNADYRVLAVTTNNLTCASTSDGTTGPTTESGGTGKTVTQVGKRIDVGTDICTIVIERAFEDISEYQIDNGCALDSWEMNVEPESMVGGSWGILGMSQQALASSSGCPLSPAPAPGNTPMAAFDGAIWDGGTRLGVVTSINYTLNRNRSLNPIVGSKFSPDIFLGTARVSGTMSVYFENETLYNKFVDETESEIWLRIDDPDDSTHFLNVVFPRVKYVGATIDPPQEGPIIVEMPFRALKKTGLAVNGGTTRNSLMTVQVSSTLDI